MKSVLLLSPYTDTALERGIRARGDIVRRHDGPIDAADVKGCDLLLSYGYRRLIPADLLAIVSRAVNLHISLLPHNRGADPNLWSWLLGTPKGVTAHLLDEGCDTGPILARREVTWADTSNETLETTYWRLRREVEAMALQCWDAIRLPDYAGKPQEGGGQARKCSDKATVMQALPLGWQSPITLVEEVGAEILASVQFFEEAA